MREKLRPESHRRTVAELGLFLRLLIKEVSVTKSDQRNLR
jgi:hypothetical protein